MSNVVVDKRKLDVLANAISVKSGEPVTMTLDDMVTAVDGIEVGSTISLQSKSIRMYPDEAEQIRTISPGYGYDGLSEVTIYLDPIDPSMIIRNVVVSYDSSTDKYTPNYSFSILRSWYNAGYRLVWSAKGSNTTLRYGGFSNNEFTYTVTYPKAAGGGNRLQEDYRLTSSSLIKVSSTIFTDVSDTTLTADLAASGYYFYLANGMKVQGTLINGTSIEYGITDGTIPKAAVGKAGFMILGEDIT